MIRTLVLTAVFAFAVSAFADDLPPAEGPLQPAPPDVPALVNKLDLLATQLKAFVEAHNAEMFRMQNQVEALRGEVKEMRQALERVRPAPPAGPTESRFTPQPSTQLRFVNRYTTVMEVSVNNSDAVTIMPGASREFTVVAGPVTYQVYPVHATPQRTNVRADEIKTFTLQQP